MKTLITLIVAVGAFLIVTIPHPANPKACEHALLEAHGCITPL